MKNKRISVFSFAKDLILVDFIFFLVVVASYTIVVTQHELAVGRENAVETLIVIVGHISSFIPVAIVLTLIFENRRFSYHDTLAFVSAKVRRGD